MSTKRASNENALEKRVAAALRSLGLYSHHNDATTYPGIPDRYVVGGQWIEFKREATTKATIKSLDRQRKWLDALHQAGDKPWVCCWIDGFMYFEPWHVWKLREDGFHTGGAFRCCSMDDVDDITAHVATTMLRARR